MIIIEISCVEVWQEISNYLDGDTAPDMQRRMEEHFKNCEHCKAILDGTRNVIHLVGDERAFELPQTLSKSLKIWLDGKLGN
ncbi:MAG TPA: anti-sigma factor [Candidatus Angelobacter sp.]|nr:anti-sigma factor [Candidatus Angelobacter sp.]